MPVNMQMGKTPFFVLLVLLVAAPFWVVRALWVIRSVQAQGVFGFAGNGFAGDQVKEDYSVISFRTGGKEIWFNGIGNIPFRSGQPVLIRYQPDNPYDARVDIFAAIWGDTLVFSGIPVLMLLAAFLHPQVVPWGSRVRLTLRWPFLQILSPKKNLHG
jgi:hypothetical protein